MVFLVGSGWTLVLWDGHRAEVHDLGRGRSFVWQGRLARQLATWLAHVAGDTPRATSEADKGDNGNEAGEVVRTLTRMHAEGEHAETLQELADAPIHGVERAEPSRLLARERLSVCFVELTAQCNERCTHCYAGSSPEATTALSRQTLERVVREAHAAGFARIQFTGGDPLISPHLVPLARLASELGFAQVEVYTNALALHARLLAPLLEAGCQFAVSLYSHDAATHDAITQTPMSHARTTRHIRQAVAAGATVRVSVILMEVNRGHLEATVAFVRDELGVPAERIGVDVVHEVGRGRKVPGLDEEAKGVTAAMPTHTGLPAKTASSSEAGNDDKGSGSPVLRWWNGKLAVAPDGAVYPCIFSRFVSLGNVQERSLQEILAEPRIKLEPQTAAELTPLDAQGLWHYLGERLRCLDCRLGTAAMLLGAR